MSAWLSGVLLTHAFFVGGGQLGACTHCSADSINAELRGTLLDFTHNSACDRRIYSAALCERRDVYVYLPPGYDPKGSYPLVIWLHSYTDDECEFAKYVVPVLDREIARGTLRPLVAVGPDGSLGGSHHYMSRGSWFVNSGRGRFADYVVEDVVGFMEQNFAVTKDRAGRALIGFSMGGFGAYSLGLKNRDKFNLVGGISPALNLRYVGARGNYRTDFDPERWSLREDFGTLEVIGSFYGGLLKVRPLFLIRPVWGRGPAAARDVSVDNPIELLERLDVQSGEQEYYVGYGKADELNLDAQIESFLHVASQRGISVQTRVYPCGHHTRPFMVSALPDLLKWLEAHLSNSEDDLPNSGTGPE